MPRFKSLIINADSRRLSDYWPGGQRIQTTITSPPYYDMKDYGVDGQIGFGQSYENYLSDIASVFKQVYDRTHDNGTLWIIVDTFKRAENLVLLPYDIAEKLKTVGWLLQNIIIWKKDKTVPWSSGSFVQRKFEYILFFSKSSCYKSYADRVRVCDRSLLKSWWIKYPERYNPKGRAVDEIWEYPIPVQGSWGKEYIRHFCPLPKDMVSTMILLSTDENDLVFDPFSGTGAVLSQAAYMKRKYLGIELNPDYVLQCKQYLNNSLRAGRKEYVRSLDTKSQYEFESDILNLRALKFGRVLLKKVEAEFSLQGQMRVFVGRPVISDGVILVKYCFMGTDITGEMNQFISKTVETPPLSKYGIYPVFDHTFQPEKDQGNEEEYYYSRTNTHSYLIGKRRTSKEVAVISPICVNFKESDYQ